MTAPLLELAGVTRRYAPGRPPVLEDVSFALAAGEYVAIMGESGVGKSTLLNVIAGLDRADAGSIRLDGAELTGLDDDALTTLRRAAMGFVFQAFHVLPYLTVGRNVGLPLALNGVDAGAAAGRVEAMLAEVGLEGAASRAPRELSGGELQRVAIARALVHRPRLLLADEPTGNLDPRTATQVLEVLARQVRRTGGGGLLITHSRAAAATADRAYEFDGRRLRPLEGR
ncbi:MAG: ABC transporter ATP-binding protein [Proteobacteria bacterium]|nr:ABC transporter ATP-binding protein [Pseudomonadota bacterium]